VAPIRIATRGSRLARWQAEHVAARLAGAHGLDSELVIVSTSGDVARDTPIHALGGTGVFVKEVQQAVLDGRADITVHSAKDLPSDTPTDLLLACVPARADARDALVGRSLAEIPTNGTIGTGSVRRRAQLAHLRADLRFAELRGNIDTRLAKVTTASTATTTAGPRELDAIVVAFAALDRLGRTDVIAEVMALDALLPQVGQGALAIECRADDDATTDLLTAIDAAAAHRCVTAERAFLAAIGGGCDEPVAAHATVVDGRIVLHAQRFAVPGGPDAASPAAWTLQEARVDGDDPTAVGRSAAARLR
jgi:hydroxymethylbilane synthase